VATEWWRARGAGTAATLLAGHGVTADDCLEPFLAAFIATVSRA
jgi:hypothetical protein